MLAARIKLVVRLLATVTVLALQVLFAQEPSSHKTPQAKPIVPKKQVVRTDQQGDPLPEGAVARLGTTRLRVGGWVHGLDFSPDGRFLASGAVDDTVRIWEVATGKESRRLGGHDSWVTSVAYSPDGKLVASAGGDGRIRLTEVSTGKVVRHFKAHDGPVSCLAFGGNGTILASGSGIISGGDATVRLWHVASARQLYMFRRKGQVRSLAFAPDSKSIAAGGTDGLVAIWETATGKERLQFRCHKSGGVARLAFAPDGRTMAVANDGRNPATVLWDVATNQQRLQFAGGFPLAFSPDGKILATSAGQGIVLRDVPTGKLIRQFGKYDGGISALAIARNGEILAAGTTNAIYLWRIKDGKELLPTAGHQEGVVSLEFSPDGSLVATGGFNGTAHLWNAATGKHLGKVTAHSSGIACLAFASRGKRLVTVASDLCRITDVAASKEVSSFPLNKQMRPEKISADGQTLVTENGRSLVQVWKIATGTKVAQLTVKPSAWVLALSPNGKTLLFQPRDEADPAIRVWDVASQKVVRTLLFPEDLQIFSGYDVKSAVFSPDGKTVAFVVMGSRLVALWDLATGKEIRRLGKTPHEIFSLAFSPDGKLLALGNWDKSTRVFDTSTGKELAHLVGHQSHVNALAFSPNGKRLASASSDGTVLIWSIK